MKVKFSTFLHILITTVLLQSCGKIEEVDPAISLPNTTWNLSSFTVESSDKSYAITKTQGKNIDVSSFMIDTEQLKFNADGILEYLEGGTTKKGKWALSTDKKYLTFTDTYGYKYESQLLNTKSSSITFGSIKVDPRKRVSQYSSKESEVYYECIYALYKIDIYEDSYNTASYIQLGADFKKVN
jgi:hypothetical protein